MSGLRSFGWSSFALLLAPALIALSGCGGSGQVPVTGTVTLDGAPLEGAAVFFVPVVDDTQPQSKQTRANGQTDASGNFTLGTVAGPGAVPGSYKVGVSKLPGSSAEATKGEEPKGAPPGTMLSGPPAPGGQKTAAAPKDLVPAKYVNPDTSEITVEVKSGMEPVTIAITSS
ncbi:MAG: carboxypeptidase-like regulatory domain-containing protein [Pirellulaceae bacterium]